MFRVGQKVVCVDDAPWETTGLPVPVRKKGIYTIQELSRIRSGLGVKLEEVDRRTYGYFRAARFRPVVTTDISIFEAMLAPVHNKEAQDA